MYYITGFWCIHGILVVIILDDYVYGKNCYNFREEPRERKCSQGCCGEEYAQHCCDATMQIVGFVLGGLLLIGAIIGVAYFCYRNKSKNGRLVSVPGVLGRLGMRSNGNQNAPIAPQAQPTIRRPPRLPIGRNSRHLNSNYDAMYVNSVHMQCSQPPDYYSPAYAGNINSMQLAPTAPMPPPYEMTVAPPAYSLSKNVPPPPTYNSVIGGHMASPGYKNGEYSDNMPAPAD